MTKLQWCLKNVKLLRPPIVGRLTQSNVQNWKMSKMNIWAKIPQKWALKSLDLPNTGWKFHPFSITQILCEINFWDSRSVKSTISAYLEPLNFDL